jgi:hypothetical protein
MKKISILLVIGIFLASSASLFAQCKLTSGDIKVLKGQTMINVQYDYSKMAVGKFKTDDEYIDSKTKDMNKKKAGSGDEWAEKWKGDRQSRLQPAFEKMLNMALQHFNVSFRELASDAKYTFVVRTTFLEVGFSTFGYGPRKSAYISAVVDVIETANPANVVASIEMKKEEGHYMGDLEVDAGLRIESCYERAGSDLASFFADKVIK